MVADSGRLKTSADKMFLVLSLFNGESFRSLDKQPSTAGTKSSVPYQRETFKSRDILIDQLVAESTPLKRTMHTFDLTMLGIGAIIGTGIFVLTGKGALTAGPALMVSFLLAAVCCGFAGLCYAEFASMAPVSGSAYSYAYLAFGELIDRRSRTFLQPAARPCRAQHRQLQPEACGRRGHPRLHPVCAGQEQPRD